MSDLIVTPHPELPVRILRIDAPQRRNALSAKTVEHLERALCANAEDPLLLGSSTSSAFCAGADLATDDATRAVLSDRLYACYELMVTRPGPVVAVIEGAAVGGGAQLTCAADLRFASPSARWRWVGPGHGLAVGGWVLPELVGRSRALDLTMTGRWLEAEEAAYSGFARIDKDPWTLARTCLDSMVDSDPTALAGLKQIANQGSLLDRLHHERSHNAAWSGSAPSARQAAAQMDRRPPHQRPDPK